MSNVIQFPKKYSQRDWDFPVIKERRGKVCLDGMVQIWSDGLEWDVCSDCGGRGCKDE